jgi:hypothetical protein
MEKGKNMKMANVVLMVVVMALACGGCSWSRISRKAPDGSKLAATNLRFAWTSEGFSARYDTNGLEVKLERSNTDAQVAGAITEAAVRAAASSLTGRNVKPTEAPAPE